MAIYINCNFILQYDIARLVYDIAGFPMLFNCDVKLFLSRNYH